MQQDWMIQNPHLEGESFYWEGSETGVLLVHGFTATTAEVRPMALTLHQAGYTVSGPLLPGHGLRPQDANRYTWQDWVNAVEAAAQQLRHDCRQIFIGGESLGGLLALYQAAAMQNIPLSPKSRAEGVVGVLVYAPAILFRSRLVKPLTRVLTPFMAQKTKPRAVPSVADTRWQGYTVYPLKALRQLLELQKMVRRRLPEITQPLLLVQGRNDRSVHPNGPELIMKNVSSKVKEVHWIENSGHCVLLEEQCQDVEAITLEFMGRMETG
jgi:carboxylesterase